MGSSVLVLTYIMRRDIPDCHLDMMAYHRAEILLPPSQLDELRTKRNIVRARIKRRLAAMDYYQPIGFRGQGSVAMGTIIREQWYSSYDIDDGIYFSDYALSGPRGGMTSAREARAFVFAAAHDNRYTYSPEMRRHCIRVYYSQGFHIDIPVYRKTYGPRGVRIDLASTDWRPSDPLAVTRWFKAAAAMSHGFYANRQLTRIVRLVKAWTASRSNWPGRMLSGFGVTKLVVDHYRQHRGRDDRALYDTLAAIYDALERSTQIWHPVIRGETICGPGNDAPARFFRDNLGFYLERLKNIRRARTRADALRYWDSFFNCDFFVARRIQLI